MNNPEEHSDQLSKQDSITEECFAFVNSIAKTLLYLQIFQKELHKEFEGDNATSDTLSSIFGEISQLNDLYEVMTKRIDRAKKDKMFFLPDLFLDEQIKPMLSNYGSFLKQYSQNVQWIGEFNKTNTGCRESCNRAMSVVETSEIITLESCFYSLFNSLFAYEMMFERYSKCLRESDPCYKKTEDVKKLIRDILLNISGSTNQNDTFVAQKELSLLSNKITIPNVNSKFIFKGMTTTHSKKEEEVERQLVLFSDKLYVTSVPSSTGKCSVSEELSVKFMAVSEIPEDERKLQWGLNINTLETSKDFYFNDEDEMLIWVNYLQSSINKEVENAAPANLDLLKKFGKEQPEWQKDKATEFCNGYYCFKRFSVTVRRHHCRADGLLYCGSCSSHKINLPFDKGRDSRTCDLCYRILSKDIGDEEKCKDARNKLYKVLKRKTRSGKKLNWIRVRIWNHDRNAFNQPLDYFCELDGEHPILKLYKNCEDKIRYREIILLNMEIKTENNSRYYKTMKTNQFTIEHKDRPEAYIFKLANDIMAKEWIESIRESIIKYIC